MYCGNIMSLYCFCIIISSNINVFHIRIFWNHLAAVGLVLLDKESDDTDDGGEQVDQHQVDLFLFLVPDEDNDYVHE